MNKYTDFTIEEISQNFITKKTPEQIEGKIKEKFTASGEGGNASEFVYLYSDILKFYGRRVKEITGKIPNRDGKEYYKNEKLVAQLNSYFSSIKKEVTKSIKKLNTVKNEKSSQKSDSTTVIRESTSFLRLLKDEASTKMTEEDRKFSSQFFIKDKKCDRSGHKKIQKKLIEGNYYDLTIEGIELPRVRQRSNSLHLGKRRLEMLPALDLEFGIKRKALKVKDDNSAFFMMTNNLFKSGVGVKGC